MSPSQTIFCFAKSSAVTPTPPLGNGWGHANVNLILIINLKVSSSLKHTSITSKSTTSSCLPIQQSGKRHITGNHIQNNCKSENWDSLEMQDTEFPQRYFSQYFPHQCFRHTCAVSVLCTRVMQGIQKLPLLQIWLQNRGRVIKYRIIHFSLIMYH